MNRRTDEQMNDEGGESLKFVGRRKDEQMNRRTDEQLNDEVEEYIRPDKKISFLTFGLAAAGLPDFSQDTCILSLTSELVSIVECFSCGWCFLKNRFWNIKRAITPVDIDASAILKIGLKNSNSFPPTKGNQDG